MVANWQFSEFTTAHLWSVSGVGGLYLLVFTGGLDPTGTDGSGAGLLIK